MAGRTTKNAASPVANAATATADSFQNFAARLGIGTGNLSDASSYGLNPISRQRVQLEYMYRGAWLVGAAVDTVAEDMTSEGVDFIGTQSPEDIDKLDRAMVRMFWWQGIAEWVKWSRLFGGAICVMLIDGQDVETPLDMDTIGPGQFKGFYIYDRWMLNTSFSGIVSTLGPHLGKPEFYEPVAMSTVFGGQKIHHTRVLRMDGLALPYFQRIAEMGWGLSVIERLYDRLTAFDSATAGAGQLIFKAYLRSLKIDGLREILAAGGAAQSALEKQVENIRLFQQTEGLTLVDGKDEFATYSYTFAGLSDIMGQMAQQVAGAIEVPLVRLMGQSPAGFSTGETDLRNHYDKIRREQHNRLKEPLGRAFNVLYRSEIGHPPPPSFDIRFRPLWQVSNAERADIASKNTSTILAGQSAGVVSDKTILQELRQQSELTGIWTNITDDDIEAASADPPAPESEGPGGEDESGGFGGLSNIAAGGGDEDSSEGKADVVDAASDPVQLTVPLLIRLMEFAREDAPQGEAGDVAIHKLVERLAALGDGTLGMDAYERAVGIEGTDDDAPPSGWFKKPFNVTAPEQEVFQPRGYLEPE